MGKQRIETRQLLETLRKGSGRYYDHPACRMWRGFENALVDYGLAICDQWIRRGYRDATRFEILSLMVEGPIVMPPWLGLEELHASHRSNLLRKNPGWYGAFGWSEPPDLPYFWPVK